MAGAELSTGGFVHRPQQPGDPVVCQVCGLTIGTILEHDTPEAKVDYEKQLATVHELPCALRLATQRANRCDDGTRRRESIDG